MQQHYSPISITIVHLEEEKTNAFRTVFREYRENINCITKDFTTIKADCLVSPSNSFGLMDGGIDKSISDFYPQVIDNVSKVLDDNFHGDQPIGTCVLVDTGKNINGGDGVILAHAPTMHIPRDVSDSDNAYWSFKAVLCEIAKYNRNSGRKRQIKTVLTTGMCTGFGYMKPEISAKQMKLAYTHVYQEPPIKHDWISANNRDSEIEKTKFDINKYLNK